MTVRVCCARSGDEAGDISWADEKGGGHSFAGWASPPPSPSEWERNVNHRRRDMLPTCCLLCVIRVIVILYYCVF